MSDRRKHRGASSKTIAYIGAGLVHLIIIGAMLFNFTSKTKTVEASDAEKIDVVKATTVSEAEIKQQQDKIKQQDLDKKRKKEQEEERLKDLKKQAEREKQRIEDLEQERKAIALKKKKEEEKRKEELAKKEKEKKEREEKEKKEKERKAKIAADKKRAEDEARIAREQERLDAEDRLRQELLKEQDARIAAQRTTTLVSQYSARIRDAINAKRIIAPDFERWRKTKLNIKLSSQGDVVSVSIVESSGSPRYDRSAETAVRQSSPLPIPPAAESEQAHETFRDFNLNITMPGAG